MDYEKLLPALISGLFAFGGAFLAIRSQRKLMRDNWMLQKRSEVFSQFLTDFLEYRSEVTFANDEDHEKLTLIQEKIFTSANKVCLYLPGNTRREFRNTFEGYMKFTPDFSGAVNSESLKHIFAPKFELEQKFQTIFERVLSENCD